MASKTDLNLIARVLRRFEYSQPGDGGSTKCPECKQSPALDPANPRDFENHTAECELGQAVAALPEPKDEPEAEEAPAETPAE